MRKTITIERYAVYGTPRHNIRATYRGFTLRWHENTDNGPCDVMASTLFTGQESIDAMKAHARKRGFTHCKFVGDWSQFTKPHGGAL